MSGIYGVWRIVMSEENERVENALSRLTAVHRVYGRDGAGDVHARAGMGLGCCVNHIPEDCRTPTPVHRSGNVTAVIDALLYNREELYRKFPPGDDHTQDSDESLLLDIYLKFGEEALAQVNGDFAGAIFDGKANTLFLFRDHLGVRPLFYCVEDDFLAFATDETGLASLPDLSPKLNEAQFFIQLGGYSPICAEETFFQQIMAVPPAHTVTISPASEGGFTILKRPYWKLGAKKIRLDSEREYVSTLRALIEDSIARRLARTNRIIGADLSGGLDSSVIDVLISRMGREAAFYSWSPNPEEVPLQKDDERELIELVCKQERISCHYYSPGDNACSALDRLSGDPPTEEANNTFEEGMRYFAEKGARIAFTGWGGDEGVSHRAHMLEMLLHGEIIEYLQEVIYRTRAHPIRVAKMLYGHLREAWAKRKPWNGYQANNLPEMTGLSRAFTERIECIAHKQNHWFNTQPIRQIESGGNRSRVELAAREGAKHNIQCVFPYLDYRVEDFAVSIPRWLFVHKGKNRYIYRRAFEEIMPERLIYSTDKSDPGRSSQFVVMAVNVLRRIGEHVMSMLNREYWSRYLDFDTLENALKDNAGKILPIYYVLQMTQLLSKCYYLQRLLEARKIP
ncbi:MAG: asparagine synthase-related protein [Candidatus Ozemobacteraceae bacterium]